ncbi:cupin domain-containing protein [Peristeroidobacter agariperforans]|uniref:cupin domain-containing protein n=1 Tax=Peristeroidobacter agariperforans TaxID=268404 RepID=UPI00101BE1D9|nr:cupin domain-containing protein [Peristeroidobacter agariperforans]
MKHKHLRFGVGFKVIFGNRRMQAAQMVLEPGDQEGDAGNKHQGADQWLFVVSGTGKATIGRKAYALRPNTLLLIEQNEKHEIRCTGRTPLKTLNFYSPPAYTPAGEERTAGRRSS